MKLKDTCSLEEKPWQTNLDSALKSRDITLPTKVCIVKAMVFPAVMYRYESWTIKQAEHWRINAFELWCWRRLLRVPWTARRSNQLILKQSQPWLMLKLQSFGHLIQRTDSLEKTLMRGKTEVKRRRGQQRMRQTPLLTQWTWVWANSRTQCNKGKPGLLQFKGSQRVRHDWATEQDSNNLQWNRTAFLIQNNLAYIIWKNMISPNSLKL